MGIIKPLAHRADSCYDFIHSSRSDDPVCIRFVVCGELTIPYLGLVFYCFFNIDKKSSRNSLGRPSRSDFVQSALFLSLDIEQSLLLVIIRQSEKKSGSTITVT